jgi:hypothetical protein
MAAPKKPIKKPAPKLVGPKTEGFGSQKPVNVPGKNNLSSGQKNTPVDNPYREQKTRKRLFGGEVTTSKTKEAHYAGGGYTKGKSKIVTNKKGDIVKSTSDRTQFAPTGNENGKLTEYKKTGRTKMVVKFKNGSNKPSSVKTKKSK